jgi:triphosphoribosyl-dephospho-CoA synthase
MMRHHPDSLIARKCGVDVARQSARLAGDVLAAGSPGDASYAMALQRLDVWLREDGHRRNPGTTADLITAGLFVAFRRGVVGVSLAEAMTATLNADREQSTRNGE